MLISLIAADFASAGLSERINYIINQNSQKQATFGVCFMKADTGQVVYSYNAGRAMMPASNMKVITTAAAIKYLGADFEYKTVVGMSGNNIAVIGSGDPLLNDQATDAKYNRNPGWVLNDIVQRLRQAGVKEINDIVIDTTVFDGQRVHPDWPANDLNKWWASEVSGLNYNGNCIDMTVVNNGGRAEVSFEPVTGYVKITNKVKAISSGDGAVGAYRTTGKSNELLVSGKCRKKEGPFSVAIEWPAGFFGQLLREKLNSSGIAVNGNVAERSVERDKSFRQIAEYKTSIRDCIARCNKDSFGLAAEALLKTIAAQQNGGKSGSWAEGQRMVSAYLAGLGIKGDEFNIADGSGLSKENRINAAAITKVLYDVYRSGNWPVYKDSLAVGGVDGTIRKYFTEQKYKGMVFGKTGYITGVRAFSGFCSTDKGDFLFSILTEKTDGQGRDAINDIVKELFD